MRFFSILALFFASLCFSATAMAALHGSPHSGIHNAPEHAPAPHTSQRKAPPLREMGGQEVDNEYFKLVIPKGWSMPIPVKSGKGTLTAVFASMDKQPAITFSLVQTPAPARDIAEQVLQNMKKGGITATQLEEKDGLWHATLGGKGKGVIWAGSNGSVACVTIIVGENVAKANEIFSALQPKAKGVFPTSAE